MNISCSDLSNAELTRLSRQLLLASRAPENSGAMQRWALDMAQGLQGEMTCRHASWLEFTRSADAHEIHDAMSAAEYLAG
jgi:hypothetical protein